jgi:hypothetical protein
MKTSISLIAVVLVLGNVLRAQEFASIALRDSANVIPASIPPSLHAEMFGNPLPDLDLSPIDTVPALRTRRLLPQNISFMEKGLWGEGGVMRTTGIAAPLTPESRTSELSLRRGMLVAHQIGGFVTLGLMASAAYAGQKIIDGNSGYRPYHQAFVAGTIATYSVTGLLAIFTPPPVIRRDEVSTTSIHKTLAWVHAAGMIITPILGSMISRRSSSTQKEHIHQIAGYITLTTFTASLITVTF